MKWIKSLFSRPNSEPDKEEVAVLRLFQEFKLRCSDPTYYQWNAPNFTEFEAFSAFQIEDREHLSRLANPLIELLMVLDTDAKEMEKKRCEPQDPEWQKLWMPRLMLVSLLVHLINKRLPFERGTVIGILEWCNQDVRPGQLFRVYPVPAVVAAVEREVEQRGTQGALQGNLNQLSVMVSQADQSDDKVRKTLSRIEQLLGRRPKLPLSAGEAWAEAAISDIAELPIETQEAWQRLITHCSTATGGAPTAKWMKTAKALVQGLDLDLAAGLLGKWMVLTEKRRTIPTMSDHEWLTVCAQARLEKHYPEVVRTIGDAAWRHFSKLNVAAARAANPWTFVREFSEQPEVIKALGKGLPQFDLPEQPPAYDAVGDWLLSPESMDVLVGLAWTSALFPSVSIPRALGAMGVSAFRKIRGQGPRAIRVGNACITALGMLGSQEALAQLALLKVKVKFGSAQATIAKTLSKLAERLGLPTEDLEEMSVPDYGMADVGKLSHEIGDYVAELRITSNKSTELIWRRPDGKPQKSLPASVKLSNDADVKELLATKKELEKMLPAQAERLDSLYLQQKSWPLEIWRIRYLDHPLLGTLSRRLIWNFTCEGTTTPGVWLNNRLVDRGGNDLPLTEDTVVTLWHPLDQPVDIVLGWRGFLEEWEIVQPFKQAHREVYLLTPAEEHTRIYSNRFAAHILRQHQFHALCGARGWKNKLRLMVDDEYPPATRWLRPWGLRAEYWIEGAGAEYGTDTLESGAFRYVATDQVRFYRDDASQVAAHAGGGGYATRYGGLQSEPLPLADVPPLVMSEIMRDIDLFVGVSSVGNDPNWLDGGNNVRHRDYWQSTSFGDLNASALTRKQILERLLPKLKIANQCSLRDRFLHVQGKKHAYNIHLGSGNILISPQDKYLCIVPAQAQVDKAGERVFLPFEGDRTLSVILSKAFLLAADDKITDSTILQQLR